MVNPNSSHHKFPCNDTQIFVTRRQALHFSCEMRMDIKSPRPAISRLLCSGALPEHLRPSLSQANLPTPRLVLTGPIPRLPALRGLLCTDASLPTLLLNCATQNWTRCFRRGAEREQTQLAPCPRCDAPLFAVRYPKPLQDELELAMQRVSNPLPRAVGSRIVPQSSPWRWREGTHPSPAAAAPPSGCHSERQHGAGSGRSVKGVQVPALREH